MGARVAMKFSYNEGLATIAIEKIKIMGAVLNLSAKLHCKFSPFFAVNGLDWQFCFAGKYVLPIPNGK